jgi:hypothetical protein
VKQAESPFGQSQPLRVQFSVTIMLILMVVAGTVVTMFTLAMRVPVFSNELRAYFGMTELRLDAEEARKSQLAFLLFLYSAPLGLGLIVSLLHFGSSWIARRSKPKMDLSPFEMDVGRKN